MPITRHPLADVLLFEGAVVVECFFEPLFKILQWFPAELTRGLTRIKGVADPSAVVREGIVAEAVKA